MVNYENNTISKSLYRINRNLHPAAGRVLIGVFDRVFPQFLHGFLTRVPTRYWEGTPGITKNSETF